MKIAGLWSGHDCSFCILEDGIPVIHAEYERYIREKEPSGDSISFLFDRYNEVNDIEYATSCFPTNKISKYNDSYKKMKTLVGGKFYFYSHHLAHAANAYYSSNYDESLIITIDGGGIEDIYNRASSLTIYKGKGNKIEEIKSFPYSFISIGSVWTRCTRYVFEMQSGWPTGHQAGTVMAMAALGDSSKYVNDFLKMFTVDYQSASFKPPQQPKGALVIGKDPMHPYLDKWQKIGRRSEQDKYDLAAGLQLATEIIIDKIIKEALELYPSKKLCLSGGVTLNSVAMGKLYDKFNFEEIFITSTPHDGGLAIGSAQYLYHHILDKPKIEWKDNSPVYMGEKWDNVTSVLNDYKDKVKTEVADDEKVLELLNEQKIVSVFNSGSESGRRALGNRSILADPRSASMKDMINDKVKHRQWFRPFAPSILSEEVKNWFTIDKPSPYMGFVFKFKTEVMEKVPAVVHFDNTARLQTVTENNNYWYYNFIKKWHNLSGVPILLNTSFNDREPICETPEHAIKCFLNTNIDYLYFPEHSVLVSTV